MSDELEAATNPHCPNDDTVLDVTASGRWECRVCGFQQQVFGPSEPAIFKVDFEGPAFPGY